MADVANVANVADMAEPNTLSDASARFNEFLSQHQAGDLLNAELGYRAILQGNIAHPDANQLLANIMHGRGEHWQALMLVNRAVAAGRDPIFLNLRGAIFVALQKPQLALDDLRQAQKQKPQMPEPWINGIAAHRDLKDYKKALRCAESALALKPDSADALTNYGSVLVDLRRLDEAAKAFESALAQQNKHVLAQLNLARLLQAQGQAAPALARYRALSEQPDAPFAALVEYAQACVNQNQLDEAVQPVLRALALARSADLKGATRDLGLVNTFVAVAGVLGQLARYDQSSAVYRQLLQAAPDQIVFWHNLGSAEMYLGRPREAQQAFEQALALQPGFQASLNGLGVVCVLLGESLRAIEQFETIRAQVPNDLTNLIWLFGERMRIANWDGLGGILSHMNSIVSQDGFTPGNTFAFLSLTDDAAVQKRNALVATREIEVPLDRLRTPLPPLARSPQQKIRVGYVSHDFRVHPVAFLTAELFELHDKSRFDVFAYSYGEDDGSEVRQRIRAAATEFVDLRSASMPQMCDRIRGDQCDILIDLTGNTRGGRPALFALRCAPAQMLWLGFIGTSGSQYCDYLVADPFVLPPAQQGDYVEHPFWMCDTLQINDRKRQIDESPLSRSDCGLPETGFVFCSFNQAYKTQPSVFAIWMRLLHATPGSVLWLLEDNNWASENLRASAAAAGIARERIVFAPRKPLPQHLARYRLADLFLDTWPVNAGATASDALWVGCPVLTYAGRSMVSRMAGSLMRATDLPELVTETWDDYEALALALARDPQRLSEIRQRLLAARDTSALFDTPRFVKNFEMGLTKVAQLVRQNKPLRAIWAGPEANKGDLPAF